ncbi:iron-containing redox enzyme family protein [Nocardioides piscis]|nr:iron-containing redox enzyme family protein [Nocardioides piscis]
MRLPSSRGPVSEAVIAALTSGTLAEVVVRPSPDPLADEDIQLSLWLLYSLHYEGLDDVDPALEWDPELIRLRRSLEGLVLDALRTRTAEVVDQVADGEAALADRIFELCDSFPGPSVARFIQREATADQFAELLVHRSIYNLRETDPQMFAMPRLPGRAQVAMAELAYDEYGGGHPDRLHSLLYARAMEQCGLVSEPGGYVDSVPATTLAVVNVMHLFALRRELAPASAGHYGVFEATSSAPSKQLASGAERLGLPDAVRDYFEEHVEADAVHEQLVLRDICGALVDHDRANEPVVLFGAASCLVVEAAAGEVLLQAWQDGRSSLREATGERVAS